LGQKENKEALETSLRALSPRKRVYDNADFKDLAQMKEGLLASTEE
jgi:hypothetical protein